MNNHTNYYGGDEWRKLNPPKPARQPTPGRTAFHTLLELQTEQAVAVMREHLSKPSPFLEYLGMSLTEKDDARTRQQNRKQYYSTFFAPFIAEYDALIARHPTVTVHGHEDGTVEFSCGNMRDYR